MIAIPRRWEQWGKTLLAGFISGSCNAVLAGMGSGMLASVGVAVKPLDWRQIGEVALSGGFIAAVTYLAKSPVPPDSSGNTETFVNPNPPATKS